MCHWFAPTRKVVKMISLFYDNFVTTFKLGLEKKVIFKVIMLKRRF